MADTRSYRGAGRRDIISSVDLLAQSGEYAIICVPIPALEIARKLVRVRGYWRTSYASSYDDSSYTLPDMSTFDTITGFLDEFLEGTNDMDCQDFVNELNDIEAAIIAAGVSGGCGCGSAGGGEVSPPPDDTDTGDITAGTGTPPGGYASWEEYQIFKCDISNWIINNFIADIAWLAGAQFGTLSVAVLGTAFLSVLSAYTLGLLLPILYAIGNYEQTMLEDLETIINDNFSDLLCEIVTGTTSATSMSDFIDALQTLITAEVSDLVKRFLLQQLVSFWQDTTEYNLLYAHKDAVDNHQVPSGGDCGDCGVECSNVFMGTGTNLGGGTFASAPLAGRHHIALHWNTGTNPCTDTCGSMETFSWEQFTGWTDYGGGEYSFKAWQDSDCPYTTTNATVYQSDTMPTLGVEYCGRSVEVISGTAFTMTMGRYGKCL